MKKLISVTLALVMILACLSGLSFAAEAEARWTDGTNTVEGTLADMVKQASNVGGTLTLLQDITNTADKGEVISSNSSITLDLNGHTIRAKRTVVSISDKATGVTVIKNGTIISEKASIVVKGGGLHMDGVTGWCETQQNVSFNDPTGKWNDQNLIENCILGNPAWGAFSFNNTAKSMEGTVVTFKNSTFVANKKTNAVVIQGKAITANAVLGEGMKFYALNTNAKSYINSAISVTGETVTMAEGTHSVTVADKTLDGLTLWTTPETATQAVEIPNLAGSTDVVASWTDGTNTMEGTLLEIAKQTSAKGGTIKLLADVNHEKESVAISSASSFTLDLNGHTLTTALNAVDVSEKATGVTVVMDSVGGGAIVSGGRNIVVRAGGLQVKGVSLWSDKKQNIDYYEASDKFNHDNIIENCTIGNPVWGVISFNSTSANQEKASITLKNSTLIASKTKGQAPLVLQTKPEGSTANVVMGEGVKLYAYATGESAYAYAGLNILGETVTKSEGTHSATILGETYDMLTEWTTPAEATVDLAAVIPGEAPAAPVEPANPATKPAEDKKDEPAKDDKKTNEVATATPVDEGMNVGVIIAIVAAVAVVAAVALVVLKKKKK